MNDHTCAVPGCGRRIRLGLLMCRVHWAAVSRDVQRRVLRCRRRLCQGELGEAQPYRAAVAAAVTEAEGRAA